MGKKNKLFKFFYEYLLFDSPRLCDSLISVKHLNLEKTVQYLVWFYLI